MQGSFYVDHLQGVVDLGLIKYGTSGAREYGSLYTSNH